MSCTFLKKTIITFSDISGQLPWALGIVYNYYPRRNENEMRSLIWNRKQTKTASSIIPLPRYEYDSWADTVCVLDIIRQFIRQAIKIIYFVLPGRPKMWFFAVSQNTLFHLSYKLSNRPIWISTCRFLSTGLWTLT